MSLLKGATLERDEAGLLRGMTLAAELKLESSPLPWVHKVYNAATLMLGRIERAKAALRLAVDAVSESVRYMSPHARKHTLMSALCNPLFAGFGGCSFRRQ